MSAFAKKTSLLLIEPQSYIPFMNLVFNSLFVITDSGGIQEETTYLGIPCFTLRSNTERPITIIHGTNKLCGLDNLEECIESVKTGNSARTCNIEYWDGQTAKRVVTSIKEFFDSRHSDKL